MKNFLYKEFRLAMHPTCYIFTFLFPLLILVPNYPLCVCTFYIVPIMSVLFLGANKGKQSNDLFYSALLPIRKRDIVKGRMASVMFMEFGTIITSSLLIPFKIMIENAMKIRSIPGMAQPGMTSDYFVSIIAFGLIGYTIANTFFFLMFYKSGRSITAPTLCASFIYLPFIFIFTLILPMFAPGYNKFFGAPLWQQFIYLAVALIIYFSINYLVYRKASKELEKADL